MPPLLWCLRFSFLYTARLILQSPVPEKKWNVEVTLCLKDDILSQFESFAFLINTGIFKTSALWIILG
jgi:hypothetical protein